MEIVTKYGDAIQRKAGSCFQVSTVGNMLPEAIGDVQIRWHDAPPADPVAAKRYELRHSDNINCNRIWDTVKSEWVGLWVDDNESLNGAVNLLNAQAEQIEQLTAALEHYVNAEYVTSWGMQETEDDGKIAREALAALKV